MDSTIHEEDPMHPIPVVDSLDVYAVRNGGGARLVIAIASPIQADRRSLDRLVHKMRNYLGFIASEKFRVECGVPTVENTEVEVFIHPDSDAGILGYLERCHEWFTDNRARLVITQKPNKAPEPTSGIVTSPAEPGAAPIPPVAHL